LEYRLLTSVKSAVSMSVGWPVTSIAQPLSSYSTPSQAIRSAFAHLHLLAVDVGERDGAHLVRFGDPLQLAAGAAQVVVRHTEELVDARDRHEERVGLEDDRLPGPAEVELAGGVGRFRPVDVGDVGHAVE
jgi:hypothetical protein